MYKKNTSLFFLAYPFDLMILFPKQIAWALLWLLSNQVQAKAQHPGFYYDTVITPLKQTVHVLEIDPDYFEMTVAHANEKAFGRENLETIAKRHQAIAAINGGFFKRGELTDGLPAGALKIKGTWYGIAYQNRGAIGWSSQRMIPLINRIQTKTTLLVQNYRFPISAVNRPAASQQAILYTDAYGKKAGSVPGNYDVVIQNGLIHKILPSGNTIIPLNGYVYTVPARLFSPEVLIVGNPAQFTVEIIPQFFKQAHYKAWQDFDYILGGAPLLISDGKTLKDYKPEKVRTDFITERHARTAIGTLKNAHWVLVVVEANPLSDNIGMTIPELANFMKGLGAEYALNLDGGSSSRLYINRALIPSLIKHPQESYGWPFLKSISDAILIIPKKDKV